MSFKQLNLAPELQAALIKAQHTTPTPIQMQAIPKVLAGVDIMASANTGTGKTAAYLLPLLHKLIKEQSSKPVTRALILVPTRELTTQITTAVQQYGKNCKVKVASIMGGMPYKEQLRQLKNSPDFIVSTPGRLLDHLQAGKVSFNNIQTLVLDEADRMLDMGFIDDIKYLVSQLPKKRQTLLFSATLDKRVTQIAKEIMTKPEIIQVKSQQKTADKVTQDLYLTNNLAQKSILLEQLLSKNDIYKAIIFTRTKSDTNKLAKELSAKGYDANALHGDLNQRKRNKIISQLRKNKFRFLVATDVASRGIDIPDISHVINFDLPHFAEDYIHRIGRTGRAGKTGIAISLATKKDTHVIKKIESYINQKIARKRFIAE